MTVVKNYYTSVGKVSNRDYDGARKVIIDNGNFGKQAMTAINESWLYEPIFASRKQTAIVFRAWVTHEVLPALRKHGEYRMEGKLIRKALTTQLDESGEQERMHGHAYSTYTNLINKSVGLENRNNRDELSDEVLEKIARRENLAQVLVAEGKTYNQVKEVIKSLK